MALPRYRAVLSGVRTHVAWSLRQGLRTRPVAPPSQQRSNVEVGAQVGRDATALEKFRRPERGAPVSYRYSFEDLRFYTDALRRRLTRSHCIVGALSMAICQWDSKSTVWATGVSFLPWWKGLAERKKFSMSTTTNTVTPLAQTVDFESH